MTQESTSKTWSANTEQIDADASQSLGSYLQRQRQKKQESIEDVAKFTRIPPETLKALEAGNKNLLPVSVFSKGFVKIYAAHLGLNQADILERFSNEWGDVDNATPEIRGNEHMAEASHFLLSFRFYFFLVLIALLLSLAYFFFQANDTTQPAGLSALPPAVQHQGKHVVVAAEGITELKIISTGPNQDTPLVSPQSAGKIALEEEDSADDDPLALQGTAGTDDTQKRTITTSTATTPEAGQDRKRTATSGAPLPAPTASPAPAVAQHTPPLSEAVNLHIHFLKKTRISVAQDDGQPVRFIFAPGEESSWQATSHITLHVDTANAVKLTLNGLPVTVDDSSDGPLAITLPTDLDRN